MKTPVKAIETVLKHWGPQAPAWVMRMAEACDVNTQVRVAGRMGRSAALVNLVLKAKYIGRMDRVEEAFKRAFEVPFVDCPILGRIEGADCLKHQKAPWNGANHLSVSLFRACRQNCPHACNINKDRRKS